MRMRSFVSMVLVACALLTGCISRTRTVAKDLRTLKAESMTKTALLDRLKTQSQAISTLKVKNSVLKASRMKSGAEFTDYHNVNGVIAVDRPDHIYVEISEVLTLVEMVSDGKQYRVSIPLRKTFGTGDVAVPPVPDIDFKYNLRPSHILDALFVDGEKYLGDPEIKPYLTQKNDPQSDGLHPCYVVLFAKMNGEVLEELWFDRTQKTMDVARKIRFKPDGEVEADIRYSAYDTFGSIRFPMSIVISRPIENYALDMKLEKEKVEFNTPLGADTFTLTQPEDGVDILDLNTGKVVKKK